MEQGKSKKKKRTLIVVIIIALILGGGFFGISSLLGSMTGGIIVSERSTEIAKVKKRDISDYVSVSGNVESANLVKVTSTLMAKVSEVKVDVGSRVEEGDVLCIFDSSDLQKQYDNLKKTVENSQNLDENTKKINKRNLENAKKEKEINLQQAQRSIDKAIDARDKAYQKEADLTNSLNQAIANRDNASNELAYIDAEENPLGYELAMKKYQEYEMSVESKEASLEALREQLSSYDDAVEAAREAYNSVERSADLTIQGYQDIVDSEKYQNNNNYEDDLKKLEDSIAECTVKAPKSGIITSLNITEGSIPTTDALMTIENTDALKITVQINEADILRIKEGMKATVKTSATGDSEYNATVSRVVNIYSADPLNGGGGYSAEITVDDKDSELLIGMKAKVRIIFAEEKDVIAVPYDSILTDEDDKNYVILAETDSDNVSRAKVVYIEKGMEGGYYTEIKSGDVKEGDKILVNSPPYQDGDVLPDFGFAAENGDKADE